MAAGVDDRVGDQLGEAELGGRGHVVGDVGPLEELAQEPSADRSRARVVVEHDPGGEGVPELGGLGFVGMQVVAADPDPAYGVGSTAGGRLEQPVVRVVESPLVVEEDDEAADRRADTRQRHGGQGADLRGLAGDEGVEPRVQRSRGRPAPARPCGPPR